MTGRDNLTKEPLHHSRGNDEYSSEDKEAANTLVSLFHLGKGGACPISSVSGHPPEPGDQVEAGTRIRARNNIEVGTDPNAFGSRDNNIPNLNDNSSIIHSRSLSSSSEESIEDFTSFGIEEECVEGLYHTLDPVLMATNDGDGMDLDGIVNEFALPDESPGETPCSPEVLLEEDIRDVFSGFEIGVENLHDLWRIDRQSDDNDAIIMSGLPPMQDWYMGSEKDEKDKETQLEEADGMVKKLRNREHAKRSRVRAQEMRRYLEETNSHLEKSNLKLMATIEKMKHSLDRLSRTMDHKHHRCVLRSKTTIGQENDQRLKSCLKSSLTDRSKVSQFSTPLSVSFPSSSSASSSLSSENKDSLKNSSRDAKFQTTPWKFQKETGSKMPLKHIVELNKKKNYGKPRFPNFLNFYLQNCNVSELERFYEKSLSPWDVQSKNGNKVMGVKIPLQKSCLPSQKLRDCASSARILTYDVTKVQRKVSVLEYSK